jgi:surface protein
MNNGKVKYKEDEYNYFVFNVKFDSYNGYDGTIELVADPEEFGNGEISYTNWGDGTINSYTSHKYKKPGIYTVKTRLRINGTDGESGYERTRWQLVDCPNINVNMTNASYFFYDCESVNTFSNISNWNTSNIENMKYMFGICRGLKSLDLSNFNTSKVINMSSMFERCDLLTELNLSSFDTSNVEVMNRMFRTCEKLASLNLSNFNTNKVKSTYLMFDGCSKLYLTNIKMDNCDSNTKNVITQAFNGN